MVIAPLPPSGHWTFDALAQLSSAQLEELLKSGAPVTPQDLIGWEYRGWNMNDATKIIGTKKFKKGFYSNDSGSWGYNETVEQGGIDDPWIGTPTDAAPKRYYYFGLIQQSPTSLYPNAVIVDYRQWPKKCPLDPVRYTVDFLSAPDAANKKLLIGKSYCELPFLRVFLGYFLIEQHNPSPLQGTPR